MRKCSPAVIVSLITAGMVPAWGNPGHEVTIAELNAQLALTPNLPELYFQRAWNYREIGKLGEARADWGKTLALNPGFLPATRELARADAAEGKPEAGMTRLREAMAAAPAEQSFHLPGCHSVLAELLLKLGKNADALKEAQAGLDRSPDLQMDLCLLRSEAQRRLGLKDDRVRDLAGAMQKLRSFVVKTKWYDAMIDAGRGGEILPEIEQELANTRYRSSWLIRRARIAQHTGEAGATAAAAADLQAAMAEINARLRPENPDLSLLCDKAVIHALQGETSAATEVLALARTQGADFWMTLPAAAFLPETPLLPAPIPEPEPQAIAPSGTGNNK